LGEGKHRLLIDVVVSISDSDSIQHSEYPGSNPGSASLFGFPLAVVFNSSVVRWEVRHEVCVDGLCQLLCPAGKAHVEARGSDLCGDDGMDSLFVDGGEVCEHHLWLYKTRAEL
jgi:hypothetical protein